METNLQVLLESIVTDLVSVRYEADLQAASLAERYKAEPILRHLRVPTLNVSSVSVDLRVAFDDTPIEGGEQPSKEQEVAAETAASTVRDRVMGLPAVGRLTPSAKRGLSKSVRNQTSAILLAGRREHEQERRASVMSKILELCSGKSIELGSEAVKVIEAVIRESDSAFQKARPSSPQSLPKVLVGADTLKELDPATLSSIKFDVELEDRRWVGVEDAEGRVENVLSET